MVTRTKRRLKKRTRARAPKLAKRKPAVKASKRSKRATSALERPDTPLQPKKETHAAAVLTALAQSGNVSVACRAAGISRASFYEWQESDPEFKKAAAAAKDEATELLEAEALRRARSGIEEPVFYQGKKCGAVRRYSDTLLIFLLKAARPEKYRERSAVTIENPEEIARSIRDAVQAIDSATDGKAAA